MKLQLQKGFAKKAGKALKKAAPTILSCVGAVGVVATAVLTAKATPKATERVIKAKTIKMAEKGENLTRMETIGACWTCYAPAAIVGIATIGSIFGANALNRRQQASLMAAYAFLDRSFREYKNSVKEVFGEEGESHVMENIANYNYGNVALPNPPAIYGNLFGESFDFGETTDEKHLFYDAFSERYFTATFSDVLLAELHTNRNFAINGGEISCSAFYEFLGLETPDELKPLSWFVSDYYYFIDFNHTKQFIDDGVNNDPVECWVIEMPYPPTLEALEY